MPFLEIMKGFVTNTDELWNTQKRRSFLGQDKKGWWHILVGPGYFTFHLFLRIVHPEIYRTIFVANIDQLKKKTLFWTGAGHEEPSAFPGYYRCQQKMQLSRRMLTSARNISPIHLNLPTTTSSEAANHTQSQSRHSPQPTNSQQWQ